MEVVAFTDPVAFRERVSSFLLTDEARHNVLLGVCGTLVDRPAFYPEFHLWAIQDAETVVGAAAMTPPFGVVIARPAVDGVVRALAAAIRDEDLSLPSLRGAEPEAGAFADAWCALAGTRARLNMSQRIYRLTAVRPATGVSGSMREALIDDRDVLLDLLKAFAAETFPDDEEETAGMERRLDLRLASPDPGLFLWEDGGPAVCLVGAGNPTPNGIRIGPVYTPREHRRRGYASALTAAVSALQLARGRRFCFLFTDLANPTSNAIYRRIGYEPVCDASDIRFEPIRA